MLIGSALNLNRLEAQAAGMEEDNVDWDPDDVSVIQGEWHPQALELLRSTEDFAKYKESRTFRFVHLFSGARDVLKPALEKAASKEGLRIKVESYDRDGPQKQNLAEDRPYMDLLETVDTIDGMHAGFPCGSFSMVRNRPGGPPPVRSREFPYGLPTNDVLQQKEADTGTVLAVRSSMLASKVLDNHRKRKVGEVATLENPPGSEAGQDCPAWLLPEIVDFLKVYQAQNAFFNSCIYMQGKHRWLKPARWSGRLQDLEELAGKCACPSWVVHEILRGKDKTSAAAEYPAALAERYANLVIKVFKQNLQLEFWRYKLQTKEGEVNKLQKNWVKSREARTPPPPSTEGMASSSKRAWQVGDISKDLIPRPDLMSKSIPHYASKWGMRAWMQRCLQRGSGYGVVQLGCVVLATLTQSMKEQRNSKMHQEEKHQKKKKAKSKKQRKRRAGKPKKKKK